MKKRVLLIGCGAIGGVLAARLTRSGVDVIAVTNNEEITEALEKVGFTVTEPDGTVWTVPTSSSPRTHLDEGPPPPPIDVCVVTTKITNLHVALEKASPYLHSNTPVVVCQNGLPEELAADVVGTKRVLGGVVGFGATMTSPGVYEQTSIGQIKLGRPFSNSPKMKKPAEILSQAIETVPIDNLQGMRWTKLAVNCATSPLGCIGGQRLGVLLRRRFSRRLVLQLWTEIAQVAKASGIQMPPFAGNLDIAKLALSDFEKTSNVGTPLLAIKHSLLLAIGMKYRKQKSSMLVALERGRQPEIDYLNGEIVARGRELGIPTPANQIVCQSVAAIFRGELTPSIDLLEQVAEQAQSGPQAQRQAA